jgi:hypothetical protein
LCGKGPFNDFAEVKGLAMKKAYEAIVTAASSEFVNTSGRSSDSNSLENQLRVLCERMGKEREAWKAAERHAKQVAKDQEEKKRNTMLNFENLIIDPTAKHEYLAPFPTDKPVGSMIKFSKVSIVFRFFFTSTWLHFKQINLSGQ